MWKTIKQNKLFIDMNKIKITEQELTNIINKVIQEEENSKKGKLFIPRKIKERGEELKKYLDEFDFSIDYNDPDQPILIWFEHFKKTKDLDGDSCYGFKKTAYDELMELFHSGIIEEGELTFFRVIGDDTNLPNNHGWVTVDVIDEDEEDLFFSVQQWG